MAISALNRKLFRDLMGMRGQALAIALVIGAGVTMYVMYLSNFDSLRRTQRAYYERERFADVFASLKRAPSSLVPRMSAIAGVTDVVTRVVVDVVLDVPGLAEPASARLVSVPADGEPSLNGVHLREGTWVDAARPDGVLASEAFCLAHGFHVGDRVAAVINGRRRPLTIVGIALSPEYVYSIRPGELVPDDRRFAVLWMERRALSSAFDMEGGFNDVALALEPGAAVDEVVAKLDQMLETYGGLGAIPRSLQFSHWTLDNELRQLQNFGVVIPLIFLGVAAFVLNVALTRALALQRSQIASLKALGYDNRAIGWHYLKWALVIAVVGAAAGILVGAWLGAAMIALYNQYFRFPVLYYRLSIDVALGAVGLTLGSAALGAWSAVRRAVRVPPAEAMRPEPPARYRHTLLEAPLVKRHLTTATRMILRNLLRQPVRAAVSIAGIGAAGAVLLIGFVFVDSIEKLIDVQFGVAERQDVTVTFVEPRSSDARFALARLPGVLMVEPARTVAARLRVGHRHRNVAVTGVPPSARLRRIVDWQGKVVAPPTGGVVVSAALARVLRVRRGDAVTLEVLEGPRPVTTVRVSGTVEDALGLSVYIDMADLHRLMREGNSLSGAALLVDAKAADLLAGTLKEVPAVAGVAFKEAVVESFRTTLAENMNLMIFINVIFAGIIAFGVIYNAARVSLSERSRELASLRVLGFTRAEISLILLGELAVLTLAALPVGVVMAYPLLTAIASSLDSEVYRFPLVITEQAMAWSALTVIGAAFFSGMVVRRRLDRLNLVAVLKIPE